MNYLAHAYLSGDDDELLIGNFIADHLRGNDFSKYPQGVINGIRLHRKIDAYTDTHPLFKASKRVFYEEFDKYSGILVDIYFDHLLARQFDLFHPQSLDSFSENVYQVYRKNEHLMPEFSSRFLSYVLKNKVYQNYSSLEGIETVLKHLSQRIGHSVNLNESIPQFKRSEEFLQKNFTEFIVDLKSAL